MVDNQLTGIPNHEVQLVVEGIVINTLPTDANGDFTYEWVVPDIFDFGNRPSWRSRSSGLLPKR